MRYEFTPNNGANTKYHLEMPNCEITGNTVRFTLNDGSIMQYKLDHEGNVKRKSGSEQDGVQLTGYQLSVFEVLKGRDGDAIRFDKADLKNLSEDEVLKLVNEKLENSSSCKAVEAQVEKNSISIKFWDYNTREERNLEIKFKSGFWNGISKLFKKSDKDVSKTDAVATVAVGNLEEMPIEVDENGIAVEVEETENTENTRETRRAKRLARREERKKARMGLETKEEPEKHGFKFKGEVIPSFEYTVLAGEQIITLANKMGIPISCIRAANPDINLDKLKIGQVITIPEKRSVENIEVTSLEDVAEYTGLSKFYIEELLTKIEKKKSLVYDDFPGKKIGTLTVGYGHTGRLLGKYYNDDTTYCKSPNERFELKRKMEGNSDIINLSDNDIYQILAQDLLNMRAEAEAYFGEDFNNAPKSIQAAIIDVIFNKGIDTGLEGVYSVKKGGKLIKRQKETPTRFLKENISNGDYVSAAKNVCYATKNDGLNKRNLYRVIVATQDLTPSERTEVLDSLESYYQEVLSKLNAGTSLHLRQAWENARNGIYNNFTL